jgi:hypothetical protein
MTEVLDVSDEEGESLLWSFVIAAMLLHEGTKISLGTKVVWMAAS